MLFLILQEINYLYKQKKRKNKVFNIKKNFKKKKIKNNNILKISPFK